MNKKNPLFTSCDHKEDCTCDNVFNELTPINPAQARQKLDCLNKMRTVLREAQVVLAATYNSGLRRDEVVRGTILKIEDALKEESERL